MGIKNICKATLVLLASFLITPAAWGEGWFDMGKVFADNGKKALQDGHYLDAAGWFERAEKLAEKNVRLDAGLLELIGFSYMKARQYEKAMVHFVLANQKYDSLVPFNPESARIYDCLGQIQIEMKDYARAESYLLEAYDRSMGQDPKTVADAAHVGVRAETLARVCSLEGGLSPTGQFKGTRNRGRTSDDMFAFAVQDLLERERNSGQPQPKIQEAIKDVFARWKKLIDIGGSGSNLANYNNCWQKTYGSKPATFASGASGPGSSSTGSKPSGHISPWTPRTNLGSNSSSHIFPWAPRTSLGSNAGGRIPPWTPTLPNPWSGTGSSNGPVQHLRSSPFKTESVVRSSFPLESSTGHLFTLPERFVSTENEALESLDKTIKEVDSIRK
jgi:hypothetical protein